MRKTSFILQKQLAKYYGFVFHIYVSKYYYIKHDYLVSKVFQTYCFYNCKYYHSSNSGDNF